MATETILESQNTVSRTLMPLINSQHSSISPRHTLTTFDLFSSLPTELRIAIYGHALPHRTVPIHHQSTINKFTSTAIPPALLHACHESRTITLRHYTLSFGTVSFPPQIYINPHLDTLYFPRCGEMGYDENFRSLRERIVSGGEREKERKLEEGNTDAEAYADVLGELRSVAIDHVDPSVKRPWEGHNKASFLRSFKHLSEVVMVLDPAEEKPKPPSAEADVGVQKSQFEAQALEKSDSRREIITSHTITKFRKPRMRPEDLLRVWCWFRQSFETEERTLKEVCGELGRAYEPFSLPTVRIRGKDVVRERKIQLETKIS